MGSFLCGETNSGPISTRFSRRGLIFFGMQWEGNPRDPLERNPYLFDPLEVGSISL